MSSGLDFLIKQKAKNYLNKFLLYITQKSLFIFQSPVILSFPLNLPSDYKPLEKCHICSIDFSSNMNYSLELRWSHVAHKIFIKILKHFLLFFLLSFLRVISCASQLFSSLRSELNSVALFSYLKLGSSYWLHPLRMTTQMWHDTIIAENQERFAEHIKVRSQWK